MNKINNFNGFSYDHTTDAELYSEANPLLDMEMVPLLQAILYQAVHDAIKLNSTNIDKLEATQWLCDEDNHMLQLCLSTIKIDYNKIIRKVATQGGNINL